ncbi:MAG: hypothetical protein DME19_20255 [Verrucomicrobia bacterium]|nr:MAG: hypothetical protein DME19_20255 [Verrucomicrobiota bacterium]
MNLPEAISQGGAKVLANPDKTGLTPIRGCFSFPSAIKTEPQSKRNFSLSMSDGLLNTRVRSPNRK